MWPRINFTRDNLPWHQLSVAATTFTVSILCSFGMAIGDVGNVNKVDCSKEQTVKPPECLTAPAPLPVPTPEAASVVDEPAEPDPAPVVNEPAEPDPAPVPAEPEAPSEPSVPDTAPDAPVTEEPVVPVTEEPAAPTEGESEPTVDASAPESEKENSVMPHEESSNSNEVASEPNPMSTVVNAPTNNTPVENTLPAPSLHGDKLLESKKPAPAQPVKPNKKPQSTAAKPPVKDPNPIINLPRKEEEIHTATHEHAKPVMPLSKDSANSYSGDIKHRLPNVPPLTIAGYKELSEFAAAGGDPYLILALHWNEDGFTDWSHTKQQLEEKPETTLTDLVSRESKQRQEEVDRLYDLATAFGLDALRYGLGKDEIKEAIIESTLDNEALTIYEGGRNDIRDGRIDPRVLISLKYLQLRFNTVIITSLKSGHGVYTASGNVSLHSMGQAVDIGSLDGEIIMRSTQGPGSNTERAVRDLALLPTGLGIAEVISLWNMGSPSFALQDHDDHIHLGFK